MKVQMISWKIYTILEFCFDIVGFKEQMKMYQYSDLLLIQSSFVAQSTIELK
jgi:hypothetical protein